jgi:hypothetical protein
MWSVRESRAGKLGGGWGWPFAWRGYVPVVGYVVPLTSVMVKVVVVLEFMAAREGRKDTALEVEPV